MVENELVEILQSLELDIEFDVILQGSLSTEQEEPEHYFTYWCWDNERGGFYNNRYHKNDIGYQISAYSTDREVLINMMNKAITELEKNKFIIDGDVTDLATDSKDYTAKSIDVYYELIKED